MSTAQHQKSAHYRIEIGNEYHKKWIHIDPTNGTGPSVTFEAYSHRVDDDASDCKKLDWDRFVDLMDAIEQEHGKSFIKEVFVGESNEPTEVSDRDEISGTTTVGMMESTPSEDGSYLHFYYDGDYDDGEERLYLRWVQSEGGGPPKNKGSPAGDIYSWVALDHELQGLLIEDPDTEPGESSNSGFSRELREALFLDRDPRRVENLI